MGRVDDLARELREHLPRQEVSTARDRTPVARNFLIKESGGYSTLGSHD